MIVIEIILYNIVVCKKPNAFWGGRRFPGLNGPRGEEARAFLEVPLHRDATLGDAASAAAVGGARGLGGSGGRPRDPEGEKTPS